jgi:glucose-1-phosphate cytidylyltransferase
MKLYAHYGFREFILCLGYRGRMIKDYFLQYEAMTNDFTIQLGQTAPAIRYHQAHREQDFTVTLIDTGLDTMTGARVKRVAPYIDGDTFMVTYGDGVADIDLRALLAFHQAHGRLATITAVHPISRFGIMDRDSAGRVRAFHEKPELTAWASAGFFVFNRAVLDLLSPDPATVLEQEPLERLAAAGELMAYPHEGFFYAMDTYREYQYLNRLWEGRTAPWAVWEEPYER